MAEPAEIAAQVARLLAPPSLAGRRVLVTAGGTREAVDAVRFVGNRSSGRMGVALAEEARRRGAEVVLLAANLAVEPPAGVEVVATPTAAAMLDAAADADFDLALLAAAVADYRPVEALSAKRPKGDEPWTLELEPTADIARLLGERKRDGQVLVTFGAELGAEGLERKRRMLDDKHADLVVFNDVSRSDIGFDAAENEVVLVSREGDRRVPKAAKAAVAAAILDEAERFL
jgi:phosphopantothenoylcysteine decarboxylase/phosphopantothenate--cysteine ligase